MKVNSTESMVETIIFEGRNALHKLCKNTAAGRMLERHEAIEIDGYKFRYWREVAVYRASQYIQDILPDAEVNAILDGNNSTIELSLTNEEQLKLNAHMYNFLHKLNIA